MDLPLSLGIPSFIFECSPGERERRRCCRGTRRRHQEDTGRVGIGFIASATRSAGYAPPHSLISTRNWIYIYKKNNKITFGGFFDGAGRRGETFNQDEWNRPREHLSVGNEVTQDISPSNSFSFSCNGAVPESREMPTAFYINQKRKIGRTGQS